MRLSEVTAATRPRPGSRRRELSQTVLAGLVGRSESWLSQVERSRRSVDSYAVLTRMAAVLRIDFGELTGSADGGGGKTAHVRARSADRAGHDGLRRVPGPGGEVVVGVQRVGVV